MSFEGMGSLAVAAAADSCSYPRCPLLALGLVGWYKQRRYPERIRGFRGGSGAGGG